MMLCTSAEMVFVCEIALVLNHFANNFHNSVCESLSFATKFGHLCITIIMSFEILYYFHPTLRRRLNGSKA
jgi:hypothetical protein